MNVLEALAKHERLTIRRDECGTPVIAGRYGQFDDNLDGRIGVCLLDRTKAIWKQKLLKICRKGGPECLVEGDSEAVFACRLQDREFLTLSIRALGVKRRRRVVITEQRLEELREQLRGLNEKRKKVRPGGLRTAQISTIATGARG